MGSHMPYQLEKGPYFSVTEAVLEDIPRRIDTLIKMRLPDPDPAKMPTLNSASLDEIGGAERTPDMRTRHQNEHWYGKTLTNGRWAAQDRFNADTNPSTGYWRNWYGNPELIIRETYIRGIEVSLGIPHDPDMTDPQHIADIMTRAWLIEIFSRCPAPWFEGWVTWRDHPPIRTGAPGQPDTNGHVTIHLHTPSHTASNLEENHLRAVEAQFPDYNDETDGKFLTSDAARGMWVISHEVQELVPRPGPPQDLFGAGMPPPWYGGTVWSHDRGTDTSDRLMVIQPSEPDGGVRGDGRPYQP